MTEFEQQQAFPSVAANWHKTGMLLRDYFAGQALQGFIPNTDGTTPAIEDVAKACYQMADAMMKERK